MSASLLRCVDSHLHLDALPDVEGAAATIAAGAGATAIALLPGVTPAQTMNALERWMEVSWLRVAAAIHPWHLPRQGEGIASPDTPEARSMFASLEALVSAGRVDAIGETGLDRIRYAGGEEEVKVEAWCERHLQLAKRHDLPLVIHCVRAHHRLFPMLEAETGAYRGVIHAWGGSPEEAARYLRLGFHIGIGTMVLNERAKRVRRSAIEVPLERLLIETDAPFIGPPERGAGEGRPEDIARVCAEVARLRGCAPEEIAEATARNFERLFPLVRGSMHGKR